MFKDNSLRCLSAPIRKIGGVAVCLTTFFYICVIFSGSVYASERAPELTGLFTLSGSDPTSLWDQDVYGVPEPGVPLGQVVNVSAPIANQLVPSTFVIPITVADISGYGIYAFQFHILYDPAVMNPIRAAIWLFGFRYARWCCRAYANVQCRARPGGQAADRCERRRVDDRIGHDP